jgi:hypothetical protein
MGCKSSPTTASHSVCCAQLLPQDRSALQVLRGGRSRAYGRTRLRIPRLGVMWAGNCGCYSLLFNQRDKERQGFPHTPTRQTAQRKWRHRIPHNLHTITKPSIGAPARSASPSSS